MASENHGQAGDATGINDVAEHQRTFEGFMRFWVYVFGASILILIFLAVFNS